MKKCVRTGLVICLLCFLTVVPTQRTHANPIVIIIKAAIKKVIKAMDLMIQRLQNNTIKLQNIQKVLENQLSKLKLTEIAEWTEKTRAIYDQYFKELWQVKNLITTYNRVKEVMEKQVALVDAYKNAWNLIQQDTHFSQDELDYMYQVYGGILDESIKNIAQIELVINSFFTQMSDARRLEIINEAADHIDENLTDLQQFTDQNITLSLQRAKDETDLLLIKRLYGIE
jgi:hypothetical protein